jgi:hypothetical protein
MRHLILAMSLLTITACSQATYDRMSDYRLCKHHLTKPGYNVHAGGVSEAIAKKGINCDKYLDQVLADKASEEAAAAAYRASKSNSDTEQKLKDLEWEMDVMKRQQSFDCIQSGGVYVGGSCMR